MSVVHFTVGLKHFCRIETDSFMLCEKRIYLAMVVECGFCLNSLWGTITYSFRALHGGIFAVALPNSVWLLQTKEVKDLSRSKTNTCLCSVYKDTNSLPNNVFSIKRKSIRYRIPDFKLMTLCDWLCLNENSEHTETGEIAQKSGGKTMQLVWCSLPLRQLHH